MTLIKAIRMKKLDLMLLYNDTGAIDFGCKFNPEFVEIHSVCLNDVYLLNALRANVCEDTAIVLGKT